MSSALAPKAPNERGLVAKEEGVPTRRSEFRAFARKIIDDKLYQDNLLKRMQTGEVSPAVERLVLEAAFCSVKVDEQGGADELKRSAEMRAAVEGLVRSGKAIELDAQVMGARRVIRLRPNIEIGTADGDEPA
jgi:hypothetical protein